MKLLPKGYSARIDGTVMMITGPGITIFTDASGKIRRLKRRVAAGQLNASMDEFRRTSIFAKILREYEK